MKAILSWLEMELSIGAAARAAAYSGVWPAAGSVICAAVIYPVVCLIFAGIVVRAAAGDFYLRIQAVGGIAGVGAAGGVVRIVVTGNVILSTGRNTERLDSKSHSGLPNRRWKK